MVDVYANCFLCIAATGAGNGEEGLFAQRDPLIYTPCQIATSEGRPLYAFPSRNRIDDCFFKSALREKGWVVQERVLPTRTLSFGSIIVWIAANTIATSTIC